MSLHMGSPDQGLRLDLADDSHGQFLAELLAPGGGMTPGERAQFIADAETDGGTPLAADVSPQSVELLSRAAGANVVCAALNPGIFR